MGMFDYVKMPEPVMCDKCGKPLGDFQTKDGKEADAAGFCGSLATLELSEILEGGRVYTFCDSCGVDAWHEFEVKNGALSRVAPSKEKT